MTNEELYNLIEQTNQIISSGYTVVESFSGLTEQQINEIYQTISEEEEKLDCFLDEYEKRTGVKLVLDRKEDMLFSNIFEERVKITDAVKTERTNSGIPGNVRASMGMFRTDDEMEEYIEDSLDRELP